MSSSREQAYRYDLFIAPDWSDRFNTLVDESVELPSEGRVLEVNCGTGAHAIELAERLGDRGEVLGVDPDTHRIEIARAKATVKKASGIAFIDGAATSLDLPDDAFDTVHGDYSLVRGPEIPSMLRELMRVVRPGGRVVVKLATHGSFDEFFSIYWEALNDLGLVDLVWTDLESLINERGSVADAVTMVEDEGVRQVESFSSKEEFFFDSGREFFESPLIKDTFLADWLGILPEDSVDEVRNRLIEIIDRERHSGPFDVSIKATVLTGIM